MRRIVMLVCCLYFNQIFFLSYSQNKELVFPRLYNDLFGPDLERIFLDQKWYAGTVVLNDNTELIGLINYSANNGILKFKKDEEVRTFAPNAILSFRFEDYISNVNRLFYSFEYEDEDYPIKQAHFFEVMREYNDFAVLSEARKVELKVANNLLPRDNNINVFQRQNDIFPRNKGLGTEQKICLYIFDFQKEKIEKIFEERIRFKQHNIFSRKDSDIKNTFEGRDYFKQWMGSDFDKVEEFRKKNDLRYKSAIDIIKLVDYYVSIR